MTSRDNVVPDLINPIKYCEYGVWLFRRDHTNLIHSAVERPEPDTPPNNDIATIEGYVPSVITGRPFHSPVRVSFWPRAYTVLASMSYSM